MSSIAILGSGRVAKALAGGLTSAGHDVIIGSRQPDPAAAAWEGAEVAFDTVSGAVRASTIIINATPGDSSVARLSEVRESLDGKVLVDVSNAVERGAEGQPGGLVYPNGSLAESLQRALPGTRVVKTLNTMLFMVMAAPSSLEHPATVFVSGDDAGAKETTSALLRDLGWRDEQILDLGDVRSARGPESVMLLVPDVMRSRGFAPFAVGIVS